MKRELKIGIFLAVAIFVLAVFIFVVGDLSVLFRKPGYLLYVSYDSAAGLEKRALVRMAGVKVGYVKDIRLKGSKAEVQLNIDSGVNVPRGSKATLASLGLLGEKHIEIIPSKEPDFCLPEATIEGIPPVSFDQMGTLLLSIGDEFKEMTRALKDMLGGEESKANFQNSLQSLSTLSSDLKDFFAANRGEIEQGLRRPSQAIQKFEKSLDEVTRNLEELTSLVKDVVEENRPSVKINMERIKELLNKIEESLGLLNESLEKINKGEGTLGKIIQQPELYQRAEDALGKVEKVVNPVSELEAYGELSAEYYGKSNLLKNYFTLDLWPDKRKHFLAQVIHDPWHDKFVYSAQGGIRLGAFSPRAGIMESKLGAGIDYSMAGDRLRLSLEGFDFQRKPRPQFRLRARYSPLSHLYIIAGIDDFTLVPDREIFFGLALGLK
jgi:phospholipid/cholesterol/gamma-HCH transport system substrate-binding protein